MTFGDLWRSNQSMYWYGRNVNFDQLDEEQLSIKFRFFCWKTNFLPICTYGNFVDLWRSNELEFWPGTTFIVFRSKSIILSAFHQNITGGFLRLVLPPSYHQKHWKNLEINLQLTIINTYFGKSITLCNLQNVLTCELH